MKIRFLFILGVCSFLLSGCGGQTVFYWERPNTGATWFAKDHTECLRKADFWPYYWPGWPWGWQKEPDPNLRFDNDAANGIWASYVPYPGAQPLYVNSLRGDWSMSPSWYRRCMEDRGYYQTQPPEQNRQVFPQ